MGGARYDDGAARGQGATVFVSDPSAEAERVAQALRLAGYSVVDVPLSMLVARVAVQCPRVVLVDADSDGALDAVGRMRELPDADAIDVLFVARPGGTIASPEEALAHEGSGLFVRPVDVPALVRKIDALSGGSHSSPPAVGGRDLREAYATPPSLPPASTRSLPPTTPTTPIPPPIGPRASGRSPSEPPGAGGASPSGPPRRFVGLAPPVSAELQQLLVDAELRVQVRAENESVFPSPEDEIEAVLPAELLAALDEPLEADDDEDELAPVAPSRAAPPSLHASRERTNDGGHPRTTGASVTGSGATPRPPKTSTPRRRRPLSDAPGLHGRTQAGPTGGGISTTGGSEARPDESLDPPEPRTGRPPAAAPEPTRAPGPASSPALVPSSPRWPAASSSSALAAEQGSGRLPPPAKDAFPSVLGLHEAMAVVARAIAARAAGSFCFVDGSIERRLVLREGDIVTAASSAEDESLAAFLGATGELPRETVRQLGVKFPAYGRHGGAALVARGYLEQDQMWPTLRAHAEWLFLRVLQMAEGRLVVEAKPPGRLGGEPSVFGGSTGAEIFVELIRRIVPPADAIERLGGTGSRITEGPAPGLLGECALAAADAERVRAAVGGDLGELIEAAPESDLATVVFALAQLGVVEILPSIGGTAGDDDGDVYEAAIDAEAVRERVRARSQLVDDGDYFAVLGVPRSATGYEVRRAFLELRRAFDPSRMLTPEVVDLAADVRKIALVLEEAYEILKDNARRDRYRRAIEAVPEDT